MIPLGYYLENYKGSIAGYVGTFLMLVFFPVVSEVKRGVGELELVVSVGNNDSGRRATWRECGALI